MNLIVVLSENISIIQKVRIKLNLLISLFEACDHILYPNKLSYSCGLLRGEILYGNLLKQW